MFEQKLVLYPAIARVPAEKTKALPREIGRDIMFGKIDIIMGCNDRDLWTLAAFGPVDALAWMPARLDARRGRRGPSDKLRVQPFGSVGVHILSPDHYWLTIC